MSKRSQILSYFLACQALLVLCAPARPDAGSEQGEKGFFGVAFSQPSNGEEGVEVCTVLPGGPAEEAGLREGDRLTAIDGVPVEVESAVDILNLFRGHPPGSEVTVTVTRDEETLEFRLRGVEPPDWVRKQDEQVATRTAQGSRGAEELWRLANTEGNLVLRRVGTEEFVLSVESSDTTEQRLLPSDELFQMLQRFEPLSVAIPELAVGDELIFSLTLDENRRMSAHLDGEPSTS